MDDFSFFDDPFPADLDLTDLDAIDRWRESLGDDDDD